MKNHMKKLSEAEFTLMDVVWDMEEPVTTVQLNERLAVKGLSWKPQTVLTILGRIEEKGFLTSYKKGKERFYNICIPRETYCEFETKSFVKRFYPRSVAGFLGNVFKEQSITEADLEQMEALLRQKKEEIHE